VIGLPGVSEEMLKKIALSLSPVQDKPSAIADNGR
jgi:hypothetical protein